MTNRREATVLAICILIAGATAAAATPATFSVDASAPLAFEGGPLVITTKLRYDGKTPIEVSIPHRALGGISYVQSMPLDWEGNVRLSGLIGARKFKVTLKPGDEINEYHFLHDEYTGIKKGDITLNVEWGLKYAGFAGRRVEAKKEGLKITIRPVGKKEAEQIAVFVFEQLRSDRVPPDERTCIANCILHSNHRELVPAALDLLEALDRCRVTPWAVFNFVESFEYKNGHEPFIDYLCKPRPLAFQYVLNEMVQTGMPRKLQQSDWRRLLADANVLMQAAIVSRFPESCAPPLKKQVFDRLSKFKRPENERQVIAWLRELEDDRFKTRETAQKGLIGLGESVVPYVTKALQGAQSADAFERLNKIMKEIAPKAPDEFERRILAYIGSNNPSVDRDVILKIIAEAAPHSWSSKQAKKLLDEKK
jgi:hypothetical protein